MNRIQRAVARMEAFAAAARVRPGPLPPVCLVWLWRRPVDLSALGDGEYLAVDVEWLAWEPLFHDVRHSERVTSDPEDLGWVLTHTGRRIGRVVAIDGDQVREELEPGWLACVVADHEAAVLAESVRRGESDAAGLRKATPAEES